MITDEYYMRRAINLATKGRGRTSPNPMVGAVIVKENKVIARGYHKRAGTRHAEIVALEDGGGQVKGGTLYVNLEPCCHTRKVTPPCTREIIKSGIRRVVVGMIDPNPKVSGRGVEELKRAGIETEINVLKDDAERLNEVFTKYITTGRPFVILKVASSLDGKIALGDGTSKWITGGKALEAVHRLRDEVDAVMVGIGTIIRDDPLLTVRLQKKRKRSYQDHR